MIIAINKNDGSSGFAILRVVSNNKQIPMQEHCNSEED